LIALDNAYRPNPLEDTVITLTMAIVELVRDTAAARLRYRLFTGMLGALPTIRHGHEVGATFYPLRGAIERLLKKLEGRSVPDQDLGNLIAEVRTTMKEHSVPVTNLLKAQNLIKDLLDPSKEPKPVADLKDYLLRVIRNWEQTRGACFLVKTIELPDGLSVPCDQVILDNAVRCLLENAQSVSERDDQGRFIVELRVTTRSDVFKFKRMITIEVTDHGPGISAAKRPFLFVDGFTDRRDLPVRATTRETQVDHFGRGLDMARAFLLRSHGELRLADPGGDGKGATFVIHLGLLEERRPRA
jgi:K+-sensing histidine kinase KdpD